MANSSFTGIRRNSFGEICSFHFSIFQSKGSSFFSNVQLFRKMWKNYNKNAELWKKYFCSVLPLLINYENIAIF